MVNTLQSRIVTAPVGLFMFVIVLGLTFHASKAEAGPTQKLLIKSHPQKSQYKRKCSQAINTTEKRMLTFKAR